MLWRGESWDSVDRTIYGSNALHSGLHLLFSFWKGNSTEADLRRTGEEVQAEAWLAQKTAGIQRIALDGTR